MSATAPDYPCAKCGGEIWLGPTYVSYRPYGNTERLLWTCSRCGADVSLPTLDAGTPLPCMAPDCAKARVPFSNYCEAHKWPICQPREAVKRRVPWWPWFA